MRIWIYLNGIQQGPYTLDEVAAMNLLPSTPVWYEGITQWMPASEAPATAALFSSADRPEASPAPSPNPTTTDFAANRSNDDMPPCPPTHMAWAIISTICCCCPIGGIIAIILTTATINAYNRGDYAKAVKMSEYAEWAIILTIVIGLIISPISFLFF